MTDHAAPDDSMSADSADDPDQLGEFRSLRSDVWRQFRRHRGAVAGTIILSIIVIACFIGPIVLPFEIGRAHV